MLFGVRLWRNFPLLCFILGHIPPPFSSPGISLPHKLKLPVDLSWTGLVSGSIWESERFFLPLYYDYSWDWNVYRVTIRVSISGSNKATYSAFFKNCSLILSLFSANSITLCGCVNFIFIGWWIQGCLHLGLYIYLGMEMLSDLVILCLDLSGIARKVAFYLILCSQ